MLKKLTSLLLSLLLCLSLMPGQTRAACEPDPAGSTVIEESLDLETLEEKCFAIRGRNGTAAKFSHEPKTPKLPVEKHDTEPEPYGGLFAKYGVAAPGQHN